MSCLSSRIFPASFDLSAIEINNASCTSEFIYFKIYKSINKTILFNKKPALGERTDSI